MESLNTISEAFIPVLVVLLVGIVLFLLWLHPLIYNGLKEKPTTIAPLNQKTESSTVSKESQFPPDWFTGKDIFALEKRSIFSNTWLPLSHRTQFTTPGDYISTTVSGFPIFLVLDKDNKIRAFHNVCRHRAYTITTKERGSSTVLGCRYHGWSYNTYGQLIKAPHFEGLSGFDKTQNGLFEIHTFTAKCGLVFVNLDARSAVAGPGVWLLNLFTDRNGLNKSGWVAGEMLEGSFNWKLGLMNRFDTRELEAMNTWTTKLKGWLKGNVSDNIFLFPNTVIYTIKDTEYWFTLSFVPVSEKITTVRYDLFCGDTTHPDVRFKSETLVSLLKKKIQELERFKLGGSISTDGDIPNRLLEHIKAHAKLERIQGREIYPARVQPRESRKFQQADQICKELDCQSTNQNLAW